MADDGPTIVAMSEVARRWAYQRRRERPRLPSGIRVWRSVSIAAMAAALVLMAGTVSAVWLWRLPRPAQRPESSTAASVRRAPLLPRARRVAITPPPPAAAPELPPASEATGVRHAARPVSATLLLQRANEARRRGDLAQAINLYRRLQQVFPESSEAVLSAAPLGGLLLEHGAALPALDQFDRYLHAAPAGVLVPEALYGRGRALRALGETADERETWRRLVGAFPDSPYAPLARRRLADLQ